MYEIQYISCGALGGSSTASIVALN